MSPFSIPCETERVQSPLMDLPDEVGAENTRMISRMILVGLVAVLGVSLPSRPESGGWLTSAHDWMVAQLAEWDTYAPGDECCVVVTEASDFSPRVLTPAAERTSTKASVAFRPIPIADDGVNRIADELNRFGEGLDIPATTNPTAESPTDFASASSCGSIELKLAVELCRTAAEAPDRDETVYSPAIPRPREPEEDPAIDDLFADASGVFAPAEQGLAAVAQPGPASIPVRTVSDGLEPAVPELRKLGEARPRIPASEPAAHPEDYQKDARIGKALGLTRDAALAWMNVLTGLTPVMMTSQ